MSGADRLSVEELERIFPVVPWREPIHMAIAERGQGFACRVCIALYGFAARTGRLFETGRAFDEHFREHHGEPAARS